MADLKHPLMGANLGTLLGSMTRYGGVGRNHAACFIGAALARLPLTALERVLFQVGGRRIDDESEPVFIVGHWRSGTTHLHNLLACSPQFGIITPLASGLPWELLTLATWLRPWLEKSLPADRGVDAVAVTADSPQEDEIPLASMQLLSVFHAVYFPAEFRDRLNRGVFFDGVSEDEMSAWRQRMLYFFRKVTRHQGGRLPLIKNPAHTARIRHLLEIWPRARFIHIYRNPYTVYLSTLHYYRKLLPDLALQEFNMQEVKQAVIETYPRLMECLYTDTQGLSDDRFVEVKFEDLEQNPLTVVNQIIQQLNLSERRQTLENVQDYISGLVGYRKNELQHSAADLRLVEEHWGSYLKRWNYLPPASGQ